MSDKREIIIIPQLDPSQLPHKPFFDLFKRLCDLVLCSGALVLLAFPILIIAILIKIDSKGPVFYKQKRLGLNGRPFDLYKFRSMVVDAEADGQQWASKNDERITGFGKFLRNSRLDEIPQFYNVIKGDMSLIGPRPERPFFYDKFEEYIPGFKQRLLVMPGITGWAQINGGYDLKPEQKILYDLYYIEHRSIRLDITIFFKTFSILFSHEGAR